MSSGQAIVAKVAELRDTIEFLKHKHSAMVSMCEAKQRIIEDLEEELLETIVELEAAYNRIHQQDQGGQA